MKAFFGISFLVLSIISVGVWTLRPPDRLEGRTPIVWATDNNPVRQEQVDLFNKLNPDLYLKIDPANTGMEKVIVQSLAGVGPDVYDSYGPGMMKGFVQSGIALDLTDLMLARSRDIAAEVFPSTHPSLMSNGRVYAVPANANVNCIFYHKDIFREEGIPEPPMDISWEELIEIAVKLTKMNPNGNVERFGILIDYGLPGDFLTLPGGRRFSPEMTRCVIANPANEAGLQLYQDLIYKYNVAPSPVQQQAMATQGGWGSGTITQFGAKVAAMAFGGRWWLNLLRGEDYKDLELGVILIPSMGEHRRYACGARGTGVNAAGKNLDASLRFIEYLAGDDYNILLSNQADAMSGYVKFLDDPRFLFNPAYPDETYNHVWATAMRHTVPDEISPFVSLAVFDRILNQKLDLLKSNDRGPAEVLQAIEEEVNREIERFVARSPELLREYRAAQAREPDWVAAGGPVPLSDVLPEVAQ